MKRKGIYSVFRLRWKALAGAALFAAACFAACFTVQAAVGPEGVEIPIVMYHSVLKDEAYHGKYVISPAEFENDLSYLKSHGYTTVLVSDLIN